MQITKQWLQDNLKTDYSTSGTGFRLVFHTQGQGSKIVWNEVTAEHNKTELVQRIYDLQNKVRFDEIILHGDEIKRIEVPEGMTS